MVSVATLPNNFTVNKGEKVTGARVIPLIIEEQKIIQIEKLCEGIWCCNKRVTPYKRLKAGIVVTGSEVYTGRIKDKFSPVIEQKLAYFDATLLEKIFVPDDIEKKIKRLYWL